MQESQSQNQHRDTQPDSEPKPMSFTEQKAVDFKQTFEDIPEALRDTPETQPSSRPPLAAILLGVLGLGAIAAGLGFWYVGQSAPAPVASPSPNASPPLASSDTPLPSPTPFPTATESPNPLTQGLLGHLPYEEAPAEELAPIVPDGSIKLRRAAAARYQEMANAARRDGVVLVPISGFRSVNDQDYLFFDVKAQRGQVATQRAQVSAPPGYSEHHTGYAVDIGDADVPSTHLSPDFENTRAFQWLNQNAAYYSFEISFPRDNPQGVSYEPWHWRFVGDSHSLETFYKAHSLTQNEGER